LYITTFFRKNIGLYFGKYPLSPWREEEKISADIMLGKKYEKRKRKKGEDVKIKEERGKKNRKWVVKGFKKYKVGKK
jgi:hypothetical protein